MREMQLTMNKLIMFALLGGTFVQPSNAEMKVINSTFVTHVAVNGGADTANPGTTCIKASSAASSACTGGYIGIPNK